MPLNAKNLPLIPTIQNTIINQINTQPNHKHILYGDFNCNTTLIGRQNDQQVHHHKLKITNGEHSWKSLQRGKLTHVMSDEQ